MSHSPPLTDIEWLWTRKLKNSPLPPALCNFWVDKGGVFSEVVLGFQNIWYDFWWGGCLKVTLQTYLAKNFCSCSWVDKKHRQPFADGMWVSPSAAAESVQTKDIPRYPSSCMVDLRVFAIWYFAGYVGNLYLHFSLLRHRHNNKTPHFRIIKLLKIQ